MRKNEDTQIKSPLWTISWEQMSAYDNKSIQFMGLCSQYVHLHLLIFTNKIESWCSVQACFSANNTQTHTVAEVKNRSGLLQRTHRGKQQTEHESREDWKTWKLHTASWCQRSALLQTERCFEGKEGGNGWH